ncbi:MAG: hypothetical protein ABI440_11645 [Casimicrobiaceae bacterium]
MTTRLSSYRGFRIRASSYPRGSGFAPAVVLEVDEPAEFLEEPLTPPGDGAATEDEALEMGERYARSVIDARVPKDAV